MYAAWSHEEKLFGLLLQLSEAQHRADAAARARADEMEARLAALEAAATPEACAAADK